LIYFFVSFVIACLFKVPCTDQSGVSLDSRIDPRAVFWNKDRRLKALADRMTDSELNKLKGKSLGQIKETEAKIPVLVVIRNCGSGRADTLSGCELIAPCGFGMYRPTYDYLPTGIVSDLLLFKGMDFWVALQLRTARASGWRDDLTAHFESSRFCYPSDVIDSEAGNEDIKRMQTEHEQKYDKRPHNRRVQYWRKMSVKYPFSFEYTELVNDWLKAKGKTTVEQPYVLRDRRLLMSVSKWMEGKAKTPG
ncbi:POPLD domain protein, partial [Oesophagostomum dentatum]